MTTYIICGAIGILFLLTFVLYIRRKNTQSMYSCLIRFIPDMKKSAEMIKKIEYYDDKQTVKLLYECIGNKKEGKEELYYPSGKLNRIRNWHHDVLNGEMIVYYANGNVYLKGNYKNGSLVGDYSVYRDNGDLLTIKHY